MVESQHGTGLSVKDLKDKSKLSSGVFYIRLCEAIEPRIVDPDLITEGETDEEKRLNAIYAISLARKLNAIIFCVWEDLVNVNMKQILIFLAAMMDIQAQIEAEPNIEETESEPFESAEQNDELHQNPSRLSEQQLKQEPPIQAQQEQRIPS